MGETEEPNHGKVLPEAWNKPAEKRRSSFCINLMFCPGEC